MDLTLTEKQKMLQKTAAEVLSKVCPSSVVRQMEQDKLGYSREAWKTIADLGWTGLPVPKEYGGQGGDILDVALVVEQMGKVLFPSPFIPNMIAALCIMKFGSDGQKRSLLPSMAKGDLIITAAFYESNLKLDKESLATRARLAKGGFLLTGTKTSVADFRAAGKFLFCARRPKGLTMFLLDTKSPGVSPQFVPTLGCGMQWDVSLDGVKATRQDILGQEGQGWAVVEKAIQWGDCLLSAYMMGGSQRALDMTTEYGKQRAQFGRPVATFQAVGHKLVDMLLLAEGAKYITYEAAWKLSKGLPADFEVAAAKAYAGKGFHKITETAIGLHGGMGSAEQCDIQLYHRRATELQLYLGDARFQKEKVARVLGI